MELSELRKLVGELFLVTDGDFMNSWRAGGEVVLRSKCTAVL